MGWLVAITNRIYEIQFQLPAKLQIRNKLQILDRNNANKLSMKTLTTIHENASKILNRTIILYLTAKNPQISIYNKRVQEFTL